MLPCQQISERMRKRGHFRILAGIVVGLSEDESYKPRFGIVRNLDVSEELWAGQPEKGLDAELDL